MRYQRQTIVPEIGTEGQRRIAGSHVLVVGTGGLGSPAAFYLAAAGVGRITLIDGDRVDRSNLQRQILFAEGDVGQLKAESARTRLLALNSAIRVDVIPGRLTASNAREAFEGVDVVIDGTDNFAAKYLINDAAALAGVPVVYGSIFQLEGRVGVFHSGRGPCYRCLYPEPPRAAVANCAEAGILGSVAGIIGSVQATEAIKLIVGSPLVPLLGRMLVLDALSMETRVVQVRSDPRCRACAGAKEGTLALEDHADHCGPGEPGDARLFIDVREPEEFASGHVPGALSWPLSRIEAGEIPPAPEGSAETEWTLYCRSGARSERAAEILRARGRSGVRSLRGGLSSWSGPLSSPR